MTLIENIAYRLGFERPVTPVSEIIVFDSYDAAREAGFRGWRHPELPHLSAYWPHANMMVFHSRPFRRVTIPRRMLRHMTPEGSLVAILRSRQRVFGDDAVWVVL